MQYTAHTAAQLVEELRHKPEGSIPVGVTRIFLNFIRAALCPWGRISL